MVRQGQVFFALLLSIDAISKVEAVVLSLLTRVQWLTQVSEFHLSYGFNRGGRSS